MGETFFLILTAGLSAVVGYYYGRQHGVLIADELTFRAWRSGVTQGVRQERDTRRYRSN